MKTPSFIVFYAFVVLAQSCLSQVTTNWGPVNAGVRVSVAVSNNIIPGGSDVLIIARIQNSSTNTIAVPETGRPLHDLNVSLVDGNGKSYDVKPKGAFAHDLIRNGWTHIAPHTTHESWVKFRRGQSIPPGSFTLRATPTFLLEVNGKLDSTSRGEVVSNPLEIRLEGTAKK